jgi:hypothetical protein
VSNRTDGLLEEQDLALIHGVDHGAHWELVSAGLWRQVANGWVVADFQKTQTTKTQLDGLDHKRHMDRERKARERARKKSPDPEPVSAEPGLSRVTSTVTSDVTHRQGKDRKERQQLGEEQVTEASRDQEGDPWQWPTEATS